MKGAPKLDLVLKGWIFFLLLIAARPTEGNNNEHAGRKLATSNPGFISIDCGVEDDYIDEITGISYKSDRDFVDTGTNYEISSSSSILQNPYIGRQFKNLRSFPQGAKNCYTLKPAQGKNNSYQIKAFFLYGNYDNQNQAPMFDLYLDANYWVTMQMETASAYHFPDIVHVPSSDTIFVCLINTGNGVPFISALELRHLEYNSPYQIQSTGLIFFWRYDMGASSQQLVRYKDDVYDRLWETQNSSNYVSINTSSDIDVQGSKDGYELPATVLRTAAVPGSGHSHLNFSFNLVYNTRYYLYLHFAEIEELAKSQKREFNVYWNGKEYLKGPITLDYLKPLSISFPNISATGEVSLNLIATNGSKLPPILNALEIYGVKPLPLLPTEPEDVTAIMDIKQTYSINSSTLQGDPCVPRNFSWNILTCSSNNTPRIISLNLSSSQLKGKIATSLSNLTAIQSLDLSCNELSGPIPDFFAQLPNLKILNLSGNKITAGSIPQALMEKSKNKSLELSLEANPEFCRKESSNKKHKKFPILIVAILVPIIILGALAIFWRIKKKRKGGEKEMKQKMLIQELGGHLIKKGKVGEDGQTSHDVQFLSFESITAATNNFSTENKLGEGGFGSVYKGKLLDGQEIAIKRLSRSSVQGLVEFKNEALLIAKLQHTNLVRLLGFCIHEEEKILVYEYMPNKSLDFFLFDSIKKKLLTWKIRFNIIEGIAQGLVYLHKYSRLRVIHRDLKPSNILLDDKMNPKISDFGLARIFGLNDSEEKTNRVVGTYGYMSPEYAINGVVSIKTDVFSFGVLLLEIVSGKKNNSHCHSDYPINLIGHTWQVWNEDRGLELIDPTLVESCPPEEALRCIHIGLLCVQDHAADRPTMPDVVSMLSNETLQLTPPKQPAFFINTVVEGPKVPKIQPESCSINNVTISVTEAR